MTSVSAGHIILTPTQPVGSGRPQREAMDEDSWKDMLANAEKHGTAFIEAQMARTWNECFIAQVF